MAIQHTATLTQLCPELLPVNQQWEYAPWNLQRPETQKACFKLLKANMEGIHHDSDWGWDDETKLCEMAAPKMMYLVALDEGLKLKAFASVMFDVEDHRDVLYCYELQVDPSCRGQGTGTALLQVLFRLAKQKKVEWIMLTCHKCNPSMAYFTHQGFEIDRFSPSQHGEDDADYEILSARVVP